MKPEEKCVSLETARKLDKLGFQSSTMFSYKTHIHPNTGEEFEYKLVFGDDGVDYDREFAAPDAQELLEAIHKHCNEVAVGWNDSGCYWMVNIGDKGAGSFVEGCGANYGDPDSDSLSESLAKAWIEYTADALN